MNSDEHFWRSKLKPWINKLKRKKTNCFVRKCFFILLNEKTDKCSAISVFLSFHFFRLKIFKIIFGLHLNIECGTSNIIFFFLISNCCKFVSRIVFPIRDANMDRRTTSTYVLFWFHSLRLLCLLIKPLFIACHVYFVTFYNF